MNRRAELQQRLHGLYLITTDEPLHEKHIDVIEKLVDAGLPVLQYRRKDCDPETMAAELRRLASLCSRGTTLLIINDFLDMAAASGVHGVHLGQHDLGTTDARQRVGERRLLGLSCKDNLDNAIRASESGFDYVAFGRFFASRTKPAARAASLDLLPLARRRLTLPIVAIGGITLENAPRVLQAGADMVAVIDDIWSHPDPLQRALAFMNLET